jgi:hypothetical protein
MKIMDFYWGHEYGFIDSTTGVDGNILVYIHGEFFLNAKPFRIIKKSLYEKI